MVENKLRQILNEGRLAVGAVSQLPSTALVEIVGLSGFDFVVIDTEHGLYDIETAGELIRAAHGAGLSALVRVAKNDDTLILKALDMGAQGVVVPHIDSPQAAQQAADACRYAPRGHRGACPLVRANDYGLGDWKTFQAAADQSTLLVLLIEDLTGVDHIDEILQVEGVDVVWLGAFDMSVSAGYQGDVTHETIQQAMDRLLASCKKHRIPVMHTATNGPDLESWINRGVQLVVQSADSVVFARSCRNFLQSLAHLRA